MQNPELSASVAEAFPFVEKPAGTDIQFHKDDCYECEYLREELGRYGQTLDAKGIRTIHCEWSCLSAAGWVWALPSYLRFCVDKAAETCQDETEFLIYNLGQKEEFEAETLERLSKLSRSQLECLLSVIEWWNSSDYWIEYCGEDVQRADHFVRDYLANIPD